MQCIVVTYCVQCSVLLSYTVCSAVYCCHILCAVQCIVVTYCVQYSVLLSHTLISHCHVIKTGSLYSFFIGLFWWYQIQTSLPVMPLKMVELLHSLLAKPFASLHCALLLWSAEIMFINKVDLRSGWLRIWSLGWLWGYPPLSAHGRRRRQSYSSSCPHNLCISRRSTFCGFLHLWILSQEASDIFETVSAVQSRILVSWIVTLRRYGRDLRLFEAMCHLHHWRISLKQTINRDP